VFKLRFKRAGLDLNLYECVFRAKNVSFFVKL
jgi:hypothetical protein